MKLLLIYCNQFKATPRTKTLEEYPDEKEAFEVNDALVAFIQTEEHDEEDMKKVETKLVKNLKWAAKKNNTKTVVLHSFAHLSDSKASPAFTKELFDRTEARMRNAEYECSQTPFGYFLDLDLSAPGVSAARIFKSL